MVADATQIMSGIEMFLVEEPILVALDVSGVSASLKLRVLNEASELH